MRHITHDLAGPVIWLAWAPDSKHLAVSNGERILVWDAAAGTMRWRLPWTTVEGDRGPDGTVRSMQWLDGGGYLMEFRPTPRSCGRSTATSRTTSGNGIAACR